MFSGLGTLISSCDIQQYTVDDQPMISFQARKTGKKSNFSAVTLQALCQSYNIVTYWILLGNMAYAPCSVSIVM
jgi:hypothetical protein